MTLKIWIASFIPKEIVGYTKAVPSGSGKTMIPGPLPIGECYLTDQRTFSNAPTASSRTRSTVEIDTATMTLTAQSHHCDNTVSVDCGDGSDGCNRTPDASKLKVNGFTAVSGTKCSFVLEGGAGNPCAGPTAPDIDWLVNVTVERQGVSVSVKLGAGSLVEPFPAFEMYASLNGTTKQIFKRSPDAGATPWDLFGPPNMTVAGSVVLP